MNIFRSMWRYTYGKIDRAKTKKEIRAKYKIQKNKNNIVIFGTPNHGNLGDYAIYLAEKKLLEGYAPDYHIFDVNMAHFNRDIEYLLELLGNRDVLILTGGGNLGNQYMDDENIRRKVISIFPHNRIVIFPQTMFFTADINGNREKEMTAKIYNHHQDLWIAARDEFSFQHMKRIFRANIFLLPDVVLTWGALDPLPKKGALIVLRTDVESSIDTVYKKQLKEILDREFSIVRETDTVVGADIPIDAFENALIQKLAQFQQAELVVTDRLHGMIFAAITQTPCLCIGNYNHKLRETYKWVEDLGYIKFLQDASSLNQSIEELKYKGQCVYKCNKINQLYDNFLKEIFNG